MGELVLRMKTMKCMIKLEGAYEIIGKGTFISLDVVIELKGKRLW